MGSHLLLLWPVSLSSTSVALLYEGGLHQRRSQIQISVCRGVSQVSRLLGFGVQPGGSLGLLFNAATHCESRNCWHMAAHVPRLLGMPLPVVVLKLQTPSPAPQRWKSG